MKKSSKLIILIALLNILLVGCVKTITCIKTEENNVLVTVVSTNYVSEYESTSYIMSGNMFLPLTVSEDAEYNTVIEYEGKKYNINNEGFMNVCKDKEGTKISCTLTTYTYDDGSVERVIKFIGDNNN